MYYSQNFKKKYHEKTNFKTFGGEGDVSFGEKIDYGTNSPLTDKSSDENQQIDSGSYTS
jgi:hypothetical protein